MACNDDTETIPNQYSRWGFIYSAGTDYYVNTDLGEVLKINNMTAEAIEKIDENDRIIINYYIVETPEVTAMYSYLVDIESFLVID